VAQIAEMFAATEGHVREVIHAFDNTGFAGGSEDVAQYNAASNGRYTALAACPAPGAVRHAEGGFAACGRKPGTTPNVQPYWSAAASWLATSSGEGRAAICWAILQAASL
jgi:hypothetical protein